MCTICGLLIKIKKTNKQWFSKKLFSFLLILILIALMLIREFLRSMKIRFIYLKYKYFDKLIVIFNVWEILIII